MKKTLLYPFNVNTQYFEGYAWALELAFRMKAKLQLFTSTVSSSGVVTSSDSIYHSLLQAHGYYLQHYKHTETKSVDISREPTITNGELQNELLSHLRKNKIDIVIIDPQFLETEFKGLQEIKKQAKGLILLPEQNQKEKSDKSGIDHFYDVLRRSELYKLPDHFFTTLGNDISVFNYLRRVFQKK